MSIPEKTKAHCHICGETNPEKFYRDKSRKSGFSSRCKICNRNYTRPLKRRKPKIDNPLLPEAELYCPSCKTVKTANDFYVSKWRKTGRASHCKDCYQKNYFNDKERIKFQRIASTFGISKEDYETMLLNQNGVCAICNEPELSKRFKFLAVDHCHKTGKIRGLLCSKCNQGLGYFNDNVSNLQSAITYLKNN